MPALHPHIAMASWIGGTGDQAITDLSFSSDGHLSATGKGFSVLIDSATALAVIHGDAATPSSAAHTAPAQPPALQPSSIGLGQDILVAYSSASEGGVDVPRISSHSWSWWSLDTHEIAADGLVCESRLLGVFPLENPRFLVAAWADAANTCLARQPRAVDKLQPLIGKAPGGRASWALIGDGADGHVVAARGLPSTAPARTAATGGRRYLASPVQGVDHLGMDGQAGVCALSSDFSQVLLDARLGGKAAGEAGWEAFTCIAYHDGWLALGGSTAAQHLATTNALQKSAGGGQDGLVVVLRLWDATPPP